MKTGTPITAGTFADAGITASVQYLATKSFEDINDMDGAQRKEAEAIERVNGMKTEYGDGVSTLITIYNAFGMPLYHHDTFNEDGHFFKYQPDPDIQNGEWCMLLHVHPSGAALGSSGMLAYKLSEAAQIVSGWDLLLIAWYNGYNRNAVARCGWGTAATYDKLNKHGFWNTLTHGTGSGTTGKDEKGSLGVMWSIGSESSPIFRVVGGMKSDLWKG